MHYNPPSIIQFEPDKDPIELLHNIRPELSRDDAQIMTIVPDGSSITIHQIRDLRRELQFTGAAGRIILLQFCELATIEAQNAFLKILEDLSEVHSFYLFTERIDALIPTIRSRCIIVPRLYTSVKDSDQEIISQLQRLKHQQMGAVLAHPRFQPSSLEDARNLFGEIIIALRTELLAGDMWSAYAIRYAFELLSLSRSNNLNAQLSIDAWVLKVGLKVT